MLPHVYVYGDYKCNVNTKAMKLSWILSFYEKFVDEMDSFFHKWSQ